MSSRFENEIRCVSLLFTNGIRSVVSSWFTNDIRVYLRGLQMT